MSASYTDAEMQVVSIMSYWDLPVGMTLGEYLEANSGDASVQQVQQIIADNGADACLNWTVVGAANDDHYSGMVGYMLDDGSGGAVFAFRGSELQGEDFLLTDWLGADAGLLNSTTTWQQEMARDFVDQMYDQYGDYYDNFAFTGHSLGGNLAIDAAINAPDGMRDKIVSVVGLDSPGFCSEYWDEYADEIDEMRSRIKHYQWSQVGAIFETPCGEEIIADTIGHYENNPVGLPWQHPLENLRIVNGHVVSRQPPELSGPERDIKDASNTIDNPGAYDFFNQAIAAGIEATAAAAIWNKRREARRDGHNHVTVETVSDSFYDFEIEANYPAMTSFAEDLERTQACIDSLIDEIEDVRATLKYTSFVGSIYKLKLLFVINRLERDKRIAGAFSNAMSECISEYRQGDSDVASGYEELNVGGNGWELIGEYWNSITHGYFT